MSKGKLIVVEGMDGAGKGTFIAAVEESLKKKGVDYSVYREPGSTPFGKALRSVLISETRATDDRANQLTFVCARIELLTSKVIPDLEAGKYVILDRYYLTTLAYTDESNWSFFDLVQKAAGIYDIEIDQVFFLNVSKSVSIQRMNAGREMLDPIEKKLSDNFDMHLGRYLKLLKRFESVLIIDADQSPDKVFLSAEKRLEELCQSQWVS